MESNGGDSLENENSLSNEQLPETFLAFRERQYRSVSTESVKSCRSNAGSETMEDNLPEDLQPAPVPQSENNEVPMQEEPFSEDPNVFSMCAAAYGNRMHMRIPVRNVQTKKPSYGIKSFQRAIDGLHVHAKLRRASTPTARKTIMTSKKNRDKVKKQPLTLPANVGASTSSQPPEDPIPDASNRSFRKRSWATIVDHTNN